MQHGYVNLESYWTSGKYSRSKPQVKPFFDYREIRRGRHKGRIEVVVKGFRKVIVERKSIKRFPV